ncbi:MAG: hypothetical protein AMJ81_08705 [Phycisphaerae bacterium SM23_33]|nr:MAG: hypothetical protein AMJ81_08705 [Phycisphaerae bacterium SM23_33]
MCGSLYLAALVAGAEMAQAAGDAKAAERFRKVFAAGRARYDRMLFNGEYYVQRVTQARQAYKGVFGQPVGRGRPKYQYGWGCLSDQLLGQWAAHVAGLGYVLPEEHVKAAVAAVFRHNFKADLSRHESVQRVYALGEEAGLLLCTWPRGRREAFPFIYSDEVWTGIEYQAAAHMVYEGLVEEALALVKAARDRHDGVRRNPWNEFECGDHYARAMSSWSLLLALSGQRYDGRSGTLTMKPVVNRDDFRCLFTAAAGYGVYSQRRQRTGVSVAVECLEGRVALGVLELSRPGRGRRGPVKAACKLNGKEVRVEASLEADTLRVRLGRRMNLTQGDTLTCRLRVR